MSNCEDCRQNYCCIVQGHFYCKQHCPRNQCYCVRCIIQQEVRRTEAVLCQFCENKACCYFSINSGIFQGQNSFRITRICPDHCNRDECECIVCRRDPEARQGGTFLFAIPISHPSIIIRNGYPQAQAYVLHGDLDPQVAEDREVELSQVSQSSGVTGMVQRLPTPDRGCEGTVETNQRGGRTAGSSTRIKRS